MNFKRIIAGLMAVCVMSAALPSVGVKTADNAIVTAYADEYALEMIKNDPDAFDYFAGCLNWDVLQGNGIQCGSAVTFGERESYVALAIMNDGEISDNVLQEVFADYSKEELVNGTDYLYSLCAVQQMIETDVDYSKYICDKEIADFLNEMDDVYRNGNINAFIEEKFIDGNNTNEKYFNHLGVLSIGCGYDGNGIALAYEFVDYYFMNDYIDNLYKKIHGEYTEETDKMGDIDGDGKIDSSDASLVLSEYSLLSTGKNGNFSGSQKKRADLNKDGKIDSSDASLILAYYSYVSTGGTDSIEDFLAKRGY